MEEHKKLSDYEFERQFLHCELNPVILTHEAHLRLTWIQINKYGLMQAKENIQKQLEKFVAHNGAISKYHKTLTIVAIEAVNHFMLKSKSDNFNDFIIEFKQLKDSFKELIGSHYSFDVFGSKKAKNEYLKPDISTFK